MCLSPRSHQDEAARPLGDESLILLLTWQTLEVWSPWMLTTDKHHFQEVCFWGRILGQLWIVSCLCSAYKLHRFLLSWLTLLLWISLDFFSFSAWPLSHLVVCGSHHPSAMAISVITPRLMFGVLGTGTNLTKVIVSFIESKPKMMLKVPNYIEQASFDCIVKQWNSLFFKSFRNTFGVSLSGLVVGVGSLCALHGAAERWCGRLDARGTTWDHMGPCGMRWDDVVQGPPTQERWIEVLFINGKSVILGSVSDKGYFGVFLKDRLVLSDG